MLPQSDCHPHIHDGILYLQRLSLAAAMGAIGDLVRQPNCHLPSPIFHVKMLVLVPPQFESRGMQTIPISIPFQLQGNFAMLVSEPVALTASNNLGNPRTMGNNIRDAIKRHISCSTSCTVKMVYE